MLSWGDEYPIHQTAEPIAYAGSDRNFYDRYFFNGYDAAGTRFFAIAFGVYPHLNIMDAAVSWLWGDGKQHSVFFSRPMGMERMDVQIEGLKIEVIKPLSQIRLTCAEAEGLCFELHFTGRSTPIEEPRFTYREGARMLIDCTRMTQNGHWQGWFEADGKRTPIETWSGTRDRSWGVRPLGLPDPQPHVPALSPQFFWAWTPLNFTDKAVYFHVNDDADGKAWNKRGRLIWDDSALAPQEYADCGLAIDYVTGTRRAMRGVVDLPEMGNITLTPKQTFYMKGIGYGHPSRRHGAFQSYEPVVAREEINLNEIDPMALENLHIQAISEARFETARGVEIGIGAFEQLFIGPHAPSGFNDILDGA